MAVYRKRSTTSVPAALSISYLIGSPPIGTSMTTFTSCGGFLPIGMASMRMASLTRSPSASRPLPRESGIPDLHYWKADLRNTGDPRGGAGSAEQIGDLGEARAGNAVVRLGDDLAAEALIKGAGALVLGQAPHGDALDAAVEEVVADRLEHPRAEADALILGSEVELVDLPVRRQRAVAAAPVGDVARDGLGDVEHHEGPSPPDRREPPALPAARHHPLERDAGDHPLIGFAPGGVENPRERGSVLAARAADADGQFFHGRGPLGAAWLGPTRGPAKLLPRREICAKVNSGGRRFAVLCRTVLWSVVNASQWCARRARCPRGASLVRPPSPLIRLADPCSIPAVR